MRKALLFALVAALFFGGCAPRGKLSVPKISRQELLDSLMAQDTVVHVVQLGGRGTFETPHMRKGFSFDILAKRGEKLLAHIKGPLGITAAVLWLCRPDSLCIFLPSKRTVLVEPLGVRESTVVLPPAAPIMIDMFCGIAPISHFADSVKSFERASEGYYITFGKGDESLIVLAAPNPWHIKSFQWVREGNPPQVTDVELEDGHVIGKVWRPRRVVVTAPALGQTIEIKITRDIINPEAADSLFEPKLPWDKVNWQRAY